MKITKKTAKKIDKKLSKVIDKIDCKALSKEVKELFEIQKILNTSFGLKDNILFEKM